VGARQQVRDLLTHVYERRLARALEGADLPRHVGVIMDGNRRWARAIGLEDVAVDLSRPGRRWKVRAMGAPEVLPAETVAVLKQAEEDTCDRPGATVNLAVGYGGRQEIADAVRSLLAEHAERGTTLDELVEVLDVEHIAEHLYTRGQPDPDLVIRTSGEQRMSGFLLWQTANTEFHFTDVYWPDFRRVDFLRALRDYSARHRRFGS
jgi:short-chain Z-isoprenyl diphosphate synthase